MKVLHFHSGDAFGGIEVMLETLARFRHLTPGITHEFALCFQRQASRRLAATGAAVHPICPVKTRYPWQLLRARGLLRDLILRERYEVVIFHSAWSLAHFSPVARRTGPAVVFWMHNKATEKSRARLVERVAARQRPQLVICNSAFTAASLPRQFLDPPPHCVLPCPVAAHDISPGTRREMRRSLGLAEESCVIIQSSRIERWKGLSLHLEALGLLTGVPGWHGLIVGGGEEPQQKRFLAELIQRSAALGLRDRVSFLGHRDDVRQLLAASDVYCQPNAEPEPFGIGFVEAMDARLPVVSLAHGGVLEIADASTSCLLDPAASPSALAEVLARLITHPETRRHLAQQGARRAKAFRPEVIVPQLTPILQSVARGHSPALVQR